jgi:hypothetical protein
MKAIRVVGYEIKMGDVILEEKLFLICLNQIR